MKRYLCVYLPNWAINLRERRNRAEEKPRSRAILLTRISAGQQLVERYCLHAKQAGVQHGMSLALAQACIPCADVDSFDPERDKQSLYQLALWATQFTPLAGPDSDREKIRDLALQKFYDGLVLDMSGTERVHHGERRAAIRLKRELAAFGIEARVAIAPTIGAAWALSRFGHEPILISSYQTLKQDLSPLPIHALRVSEEVVRAFSQLGIRSIGELLKLPPKTLLHRFGAELLKRIDQALAQANEGFSAVPLPRTFFVQKKFDVPLTNISQVQTVVLMFLQRLLQILRSHQKQALSFFISLRGESFQVTKEISLLTASSDVKQLSSVVSPVIEKLSFSGDISAVRIEARGIERACARQGDFIKGEKAATLEQALAELLNSMVVRLGRSRVCEIALHESYIPERSFSYEPLDPRQKKTVETVKKALPRERPSCLFSPPHPIRAIALLPDNPPAWFEWRGTKYTVRSGIGPERVTEEWWHSIRQATTAEREYFKVQDHTGRWLWIFRQQPNEEWFVQGMWS